MLEMFLFIYFGIGIFLAFALHRITYKGNPVSTWTRLGLRIAIIVAWPMLFLLRE